MDGIEATRRIRTDETGRYDTTVPISCYDGRHDRDREKFLEAQCGRLSGQTSGCSGNAQLYAAGGGKPRRGQDLPPGGRPGPGKRA